MTMKTYLIEDFYKTYTQLSAMRCDVAAFDKLAKGYLDKTLECLCEAFIDSMSDVAECNGVEFDAGYANDKFRECIFEGCYEFVLWVHNMTTAGG